MIIVPKGKRITFNLGNNANTVTVYTDDDLSFNIASEFSPLAGSNDTELLTLVGGAYRDLTGKAGFSGQFKQFGFQVWQASKPISCTVQCTLYTKPNVLGVSDAYTDVVVPARKLMSIPLPVDTGNGNLEPPGPSIFAAFESIAKGGPKSGKKISVDIGGVYTMYPAIVSRVEPTFSREKDEKGFPLWCKLQIDMSGLFNATTNDAYSFMRGGK